MQTIPINWQLGKLPANIEANPQAFYEAIFEATQAKLDFSPFLTGQIGGNSPGTNVGPWLKDSKTWWVWDTQSSSYQPMTNELEIGDLVPTASEQCDGDRFMFCDGRAVTRSAPYDKLFARIGTKYGEGDGTTTFNIPDCQGRMLIGAGIGHYTDGTALTARTVGQTGGLEMVALKGEEMAVPAVVTAATGSGTRSIQVWNEWQSNGSPHNNMPPWLSVLYKVKYA